MPRSDAFRDVILFNNIARYSGLPCIWGLQDAGPPMKTPQESIYIKDRHPSPSLELKCLNPAGKRTPAAEMEGRPCRQLPTFNIQYLKSTEMLSIITKCAVLLLNNRLSVYFLLPIFNLIRNFHGICRPICWCILHKNVISDVSLWKKGKIQTRESERQICVFRKLLVELSLF